MSLFPRCRWLLWCNFSVNRRWMNEFLCLCSSSKLFLSFRSMTVSPIATSVAMIHARCFIKTPLHWWTLTLHHGLSTWNITLGHFFVWMLFLKLVLEFSVITWNSEITPRWWDKKIHWNHVYRTCKQVKPGDSQDYNSTKNMWHIWLLVLCSLYLLEVVLCLEVPL